MNTLDIIPSAAYHHKLLKEYATYHHVSIKILDDNKYKLSLDKKTITGDLKQDFQESQEDSVSFMNNETIEKPKMPANLLKELSSKAGTIYTKETMKYIEDYAEYL